MGGGSRPTSRFLHLCRVILGVAAILGLCADGLAARTSKPLSIKPALAERSAARRVAVKRIKPPKQSPVRQILAAQPAANQQTARQYRRTHWSRARKGLRYRHVAARTADTEEKSAGSAERLNPNTVTILAGGLNSTDLAIADDLAAALDDSDTLRILPMIGRGGALNIRDLRTMKGVDLGITQSNVLARYRRGEFGPPDDKLTYVAKLFNEELHVLVRVDSGINAIEQLAGRTVNLGPVGGGSELVGRDVFERLRIAVRSVDLSATDAVEKLKAGEIDAVVLLAGKPTPTMARLDGVRLLSVPYAKSLQDDYLPASLGAEDYPALMDPGRAIDTVAVGSVLIAYNAPRDSDRYRRVERFVDAFFSRIGALQVAPRHPKWREVNLAAVLPDVPRFSAAQDWIKRTRDEAADRERQFEEFVAARRAGPVSTEERNRLFREFLQSSEVRDLR